MINEMIDRMARAILTEHLCLEDDSCKPHGWDDADQADRDEALALARIAIVTMREPTESMQAVGRDILATWLPRGELSRPPDHQWQPSNEIYQGMLDAILGEKP